MIVPSQSENTIAGGNEVDIVQIVDIEGELILQKNSIILMKSNNDYGKKKKVC